MSAVEESIRVISVYATRWRYQGTVPGGEPNFDLGKLREHYSLFQDQMPQVLVHETPAVEQVAFPEADSEPAITAVETWLFTLPSDQIVAAVSLQFNGPHPGVDPGPTIKVLERCAYADVSIGGQSIADYIGSLAARVDAQQVDSAPPSLPPERHQLVFARQITGEDGAVADPERKNIWRLLYRVDPPYLKQFMNEQEPVGLNQEGQVFGAVTPYVSVLFGHRTYVENSIFLTTVQAIGTAARFRQIWRSAYQDVRGFRKNQLQPEVGKQSRDSLEGLVDRLGNLELDLSFSVETSADLGLLIPSLRIESFHRALYAVLELPTRAETVSRMFARLDSSIKSEITAIEIRERREEEEKRLLRDAAAAAILSFGAVPISFLLGFFGVNSSQVRDTDSMFDWQRFWPVYFLAAFFASIPILVFYMMHGRAWLTAARAWGSRRRSRAAQRAAARSQQATA